MKSYDIAHFAIDDINWYYRVAEVIGKRRSALSIEVDDNFTSNQQDDG